MDILELLLGLLLLLMEWIVTHWRTLAGVGAGFLFLALIAQVVGSVGAQCRAENEAFRSEVMAEIEELKLGLETANERLDEILRKLDGDDDVVEGRLDQILEKLDG